MTRKAMGPIDKMFIWGESRESMMHVAGLQIFTPPADAGPHFVRDLVDSLLAVRKVERPWNLRLATPNFQLNPLHAWVEEASIDLDYHVRHSALPAPGGERELGKLVSRLHANPVDFQRPPWELHVIEGLAGGRFAFYTKIHHALVDGYSAMKIMTRSMSTGPDERDKPIFYALPEPRREKAPRVPRGKPDLLGGLANALRRQATSIGELGSAVREMANAAVAGNDALKTPLQAPPCVLNGRITRNRRFATQQIPLDRLRAVATAAGGTLNDVVIALCAAGLRRYLHEIGALPKAPLVAYLPVNVRPKGDEGGGNAIGAILVSMATNVADPKKRLETIIASTSRAKEQLRGMSQRAILEYSMLLMMPFLLQLARAMTGDRIKMPLNFNLCISNVPGPDEPLFLRGARMDAVYPVSIPTHAMGLNITVESYAGYLDFGFVGCRDTLPHMQRLAVHTGEALDELEAVYFPVAAKARASRKAPSKPAKAESPRMSKPAVKKPAAKAAVKKPAAKAATVKKPAVQKVVVKAATAKKPTVKQAAAKIAVVKKPAAKKAVVKAPAARKARRTPA